MGSSSSVHDPGRRTALVAGVVATVVALLHGARLWWVSDDAFISFRYAANLVRGVGLVYNPGERVEGYTNPLWTLLAAAGLRLGAPAETWCNAWSLATYGGTIALLAWVHLRWRERLAPLPPTIPLAAILGALHPDWATFATSGLETAAFTLAVTAGLVLVAEPAVSPRRAAAAGLTLALASLTRHDGILLAFVGAVSLARFGRRGLRSAAAFGIAFVLVFGPFSAWRIHYYGDFFPNTYYAKSASVPWWSQGLIYLVMYLARYWTLTVVPVLLGAAVILTLRKRSDHGARWLERLGAPLAILAAGTGLYVVYVTRVGGDFMFARFLIPATPLALLLLDASVLRFAPVVRAGWPALAAAVVAAGIAQALTSSPANTERGTIGVVDERAYYQTRPFIAYSDEVGATVTPFVKDLPVVLAIFGAQARLAYRAPFQTVIEALAGLTDAHIAHQTLAERGRPGHEKHASWDYLILERKADLTFTRGAEEFGLNDYIPLVLVDMGGYEARLLHWNPLLVAALRARGAKVQDFPAKLDATLAHLDQLPDEVALHDYQGARHFYFAHVQDPVREAAFARRLAHRTVIGPAPTPKSP